MDINIRKALETDINSMTSVYNDSINIFSSDIRRESDYNNFADVFKKNTVFVAENQNESKIIGWISYNIKDNYAFITGLYILLNEQRKSIGTKLLEYCINKLRENNCKLIILLALKIAPWSIEFYKKNRFYIYDPVIEPENDLDLLKSEKINNWEILMYKRIL